MARRPRIHYEGALYHVICRGNNGEYIFKNDEDKKEYFEIIIRYKKRYGFKLYSYCLMDNHIHMLIEVGEVPLSKIMQGIQQVYTQMFNKKYNRKGHVFQQRYKAILCNKDNYLLSLIRYIHQNPIRAGIREGFDYPWSSHSQYIKGQDSELLDVEYVLKIFSKNEKEAINIYLEYVEEKETEIEDKSEREFSQGIDEFEEKIEEKKEIEFDKIVSEVCKHFGLSIEDLKKRTKRQKIVEARKIIVILSKMYTKKSNKEIAEYLNISESNVSIILASSEEEELKSKVNELKKNLNF